MTRFRDLPPAVQELLREQVDSTLRLHEASGLSALECNKIVLAGGGMQDLQACIDEKQ